MRELVRLAEVREAQAKEQMTALLDNRSNMYQAPGTAAESDADLAGVEQQIEESQRSKALAKKKFDKLRTVCIGAHQVCARSLLPQPCCRQHCNTAQVQDRLRESKVKATMSCSLVRCCKALVALLLRHMLVAPEVCFGRCSFCPCCFKSTGSGPEHTTDSMLLSNLYAKSML